MLIEFIIVAVSCDCCLC